MGLDSWCRAQNRMRNVSANHRRKAAKNARNAGDTPKANPRAVGMTSGENSSNSPKRAALGRTLAGATGDSLIAHALKTLLDQDPPPLDELAGTVATTPKRPT